MGILSLLDKRSSVVDPVHPGDPALSRMFGFGNQSITGVHVTPDKAMQDAVVFACIRVLAEDVAKLPLFVYQKTNDGGKTRATDHPLYDVLHSAPNRNQTSMEWRETGMAHVLLRGNHTSKIIPLNGRGVGELMPLSPDHLKIKKTPSGYRVFEYTPPDGKREVLMLGEVLHVPGLSLNGISGLDPISYHRETIGMSLGIKEYGARFFGNGANSSLVLKHKGRLSDDAVKHLRESVTEKQAGLKNAHRPWILEEGMDIEKLSITPENAQFLESRKFSRSEIAGIFRVPPHKIGDLEKATFSNIEQSSIDYVVDSLMPWLVRWEQAMSRWVLTEADRRKGFFIQFEVKGLLRGDAQARSNYYRTRFNIGSLSQNDIRRLEDEDPIAGGDQYFVPLNMRPHDQPMPEPDGLKGVTT